MLRIISGPQMQLQSRHVGVRMSETLPLLIDRVDTPIGEMLIVADREGNLRAVDWTDHETRMRRFLRLHYGENGFRLETARNLNDLTYAISRYFEGELTAIDMLPVQTSGTLFSARCGGRCETSPAARPFLTRNLPSKLVDLQLSGLLVWPMVQIRLELSCLVIA
jgi:hypothetical protein